MADKIGKDRLNRFVEDLRSTHKDNLAWVVLYGSVAAGDQIASESDYNTASLVYSRFSVSEKVMCAND